MSLAEAQQAFFEEDKEHASSSGGTVGDRRFVLVHGGAHTRSSVFCFRACLRVVAVQTDAYVCAHVCVVC